MGAPEKRRAQRAFLGKTKNNEVSEVFYKTKNRTNEVYSEDGARSENRTRVPALARRYNSHYTMRALRARGLYWCLRKFQVSFS